MIAQRCRRRPVKDTQWMPNATARTLMKQLANGQLKHGIDLITTVRSRFKFLEGTEETSMAVEPEEA